MKKCLVLLCTYNGEKYLRAQIDSVIAQEGVDVFIKVSDDISNDNTIAILDEYIAKGAPLSYSINDKNKMFTYNFIDLLFANKNEEYDYYAFSDQDDVWLPNKLISAIKKIEELKENEKGTLYCSNLILVDKDLNKIGMMEDESIITKTNKNTYLFENIATGCTVVFNHKFMKHATKYYPEGIHYHDYWVFMIAVYTAQYVYDFNAYINYRQHESNLVGENNGKSIKALWKKWKQSDGHQSVLAKQLLIGFKDDIDPEQLENITKLATYQKKFKYKMSFIFNKKYANRKHNFLKKIKVLFNKY